MSQFTRQYRVTHLQMLQFREQLDGDKRCSLRGNDERGQLIIAVPFVGEILLSYQHHNGQLTVSLIAAPGIIQRETIWNTIAQKIEAAQEACPLEV
jgi:hypothetical protein